MEYGQHGMELTCGNTNQGKFIVQLTWKMDGECVFSVHLVTRVLNRMLFGESFRN